MEEEEHAGTAMPKNMNSGGTGEHVCECETVCIEGKKVGQISDLVRKLDNPAQA